jgi:hypothetical protein
MDFKNSFSQETRRIWFVLIANEEKYYSYNKKQKNIKTY